MDKSKIKTILMLIVVIIMANSLVYYVTEQNKEQRVEIALNDKINSLQMHYEILLHHQKIAADTAYSTTLALIPNFIEIYTKIQTATEKEKIILREKLYKSLKVKYKMLKRKGVLQYHFLLPNNISFLRMHKPSKFGDDLTDIREDFKYTNETKKPIRGFVQGRVAHGFRNTYPIISKNGVHLGAMEISYSSDNFQNYLTNISKIHTHFLVDKDIFDVKTWNRDDLVLKYVQSNESEKFMLAINGAQSKKKCIIENNNIIKKIKQEIEVNMKKGKKFALYTFNDMSVVNIVSFYPIKNLSNTKTLAWIVSYEKSDFIYNTLKGNIIVRIISFIIFLIFGYLIYKQISIQQMIKKDHLLLNDVLNSTDDIMFATDFVTVTFANRKFKEFFNVIDEDEFNSIINKDLLKLFIATDGCLHAGLLKEKELFSTLMTRTSQDERVVAILDKSLNQKVFNINITKTNYNNNSDYLITLTDITKLKEKEIKIQRKAYIDGLTQIYNRNKFDEISQNELKRDIRYKIDLSIAIIDIDHFKDFNDKHGHLIGDEILIMLAQNINSHVRDTDTFARWGGEEFVILFPETNKDSVKIICEKFRVSIEKLLHPQAGGITASFGVTQYEADDTLETMFKRCDDALYEAKASGRNMVCVN